MLAQRKVHRLQGAHARKALVYISHFQYRILFHQRYSLLFIMKEREASISNSLCRNPLFQFLITETVSCPVS